MMRNVLKRMKNHFQIFIFLVIVKIHRKYDQNMTITRKIKIGNLISLLNHPIPHLSCKFEHFWKKKKVNFFIFILLNLGIFRQVISVLYAMYVHWYSDQSCINIFHFPINIFIFPVNNSHSNRYFKFPLSCHFLKKMDSQFLITIAPPYPKFTLLGHAAPGGIRDPRLHSDCPHYPAGGATPRHWGLPCPGRPFCYAQRRFELRWPGRR